MTKFRPSRVFCFLCFRTSVVSIHASPTFLSSTVTDSHNIGKQLNVPSEAPFNVYTQMDQMSPQTRFNAPDTYDVQQKKEGHLLQHTNQWHTTGELSPEYTTISTNLVSAYLSRYPPGYNATVSWLQGMVSICHLIPASLSKC